VSGERRVRILSLLVGSEADRMQAEQLCRVCAQVTEMTGAGLMLMSSDIPRGSVCTTDGVSALIEHLQFTLGEGPCVDAHRQGRPILEPDLARPVVPRWPAFSGPVLEAGACAVFGFPLRVGAVRLGALNLYRDAAGPLTEDQHADALAMADVAAHAILVMQADASPGRLATELESSSNFNYVVHQAAGMVAAQLNVPISQALIRLRSFAFGNDRQLDAVAGDVVSRVLRFTDNDDLMD
jgi:GAF domain